MANSGLNKNIDNVINVLNNKADVNLENSAKAGEIERLANSTHKLANSTSQLVSVFVNQVENELDEKFEKSGGTISGNTVVDGNLTVTGTINATITGSSDSAMSATKDSDGNVITSTYLKKIDAANTYVNLSGNQTIAGTKTFSSIVLGDQNVADYYYHKGCGDNYKPSSDTTAVWSSKRPGHYWYSTTGLLTDQPSQYGHLLNLGQNTEVFQLWCCAPSGPLYYRSGNSNGGWNGTTWKCLDGKANITTTYSNGKNWYRVWSDGWIEQGGKHGAINGTITFHKSFTTINYTLLLAVTDYRGGSYAPSSSGLSTTGFTLFSAGNATLGGFWYACGY